jgi:hypothetical protein
MSSTLTSWKEIAQHLSKGVRTVQLWEKQIGLPVHRPQERVKRMVLAFTDELDVWLRSQFNNRGKSELELLRSHLAELTQENETLRAKLAIAESAARILSPSGRGAIEHECQSTTEFHRVKTIAEQRRLQAMRSQLAFGFTLCRLAETSLLFGHDNHAHQALASVRKLCDTLQHHLNERNYVPPNEAEKLRTELVQLGYTVSAVEKAPLM